LRAQTGAPSPRSRPTRTIRTGCTSLDSDLTRAGPTPRRRLRASERSLASLQFRARPKPTPPAIGLRSGYHSRARAGATRSGSPCEHAGCGSFIRIPRPSLPPGREPGPGTIDRQESVCVSVWPACKLGWARSYFLGCTVSARARNPRVLESGRGGVTSPPCRSVVTSPLTPAAGTGSRPPVPSVSLTGRGPQPTAAAGGRSECEVGPPHACGRTQPVRLGRSGRAGTPAITIPYPGLERSQKDSGRGTTRAGPTDMTRQESLGKCILITTPSHRLTGRMP